MVYLSKIYTRSGDTGETMLSDGSRAWKDALRVDAYGQVDELNAVVGLIRLELDRLPSGDHDAFARDLDLELARVQQELFDLGAELSHPGAATGEASVVMDEAQVTRLEAEIDGHNESLEPLRSFVLPGGGPVGATAHLARTVCRRAERAAVALAREEAVRGPAIAYLNRLADYFFVVSRAAARATGHGETLWTPKSTG